MSDVRRPPSAGQEDEPPEPPPIDRKALRAVLVDLRVAFDDGDAVAEDMLRRARRRELGPVLHRTNYREARRKVLTTHAEAMRLIDAPEPEPGAAPH